MSPAWTIGNGTTSQAAEKLQTERESGRARPRSCRHAVEIGSALQRLGCFLAPATLSPQPARAESL